MWIGVKSEAGRGPWWSFGNLTAVGSWVLDRSYLGRSYIALESALAEGPRGVRAKNASQIRTKELEVKQGLLGFPPQSPNRVGRFFTKFKALPQRTLRG